MSAARNLKAFTLIELLIVVAIIALLVGILVPAVQHAQDMARDSVVLTQLHAIGVGLEMFKQDSASGRGQYADSYYESPATATKFPGYVSLAIQLVGRDRRGYDVGDVYDDTNADYLRREPYIKLETTEIAEANPDPDPEDLMPILLCKWGQPILYFRAEPGTTARNDIDEIYIAEDNLDEMVSSLDENSFQGALDHTDDALVEYGSGSPYDTFYEQIENTDSGIPGNPVPYNVESFILWSAGKDGEYGTDDDIKNF